MTTYNPTPSKPGGWGPAWSPSAVFSGQIPLVDYKPNQQLSNQLNQYSNQQDQLANWYKSMGVNNLGNNLQTQNFGNQSAGNDELFKAMQDSFNNMVGQMGDKPTATQIAPPITPQEPSQINPIQSTAETIGTVNGLPPQINPITSTAETIGTINGLPPQINPMQSTAETVGTIDGKAPKYNPMMTDNGAANQGLLAAQSGDNFGPQGSQPQVSLPSVMQGGLLDMYNPVQNNPLGGNMQIGLELPSWAAADPNAAKVGYVDTVNGQNVNVGNTSAGGDYGVAADNQANYDYSKISNYGFTNSSGQNGSLTYSATNDDGTIALKSATGNQWKYDPKTKQLSMLQGGKWNVKKSNFEFN